MDSAAWPAATPYGAAVSAARKAEAGVDAWRVGLGDVWMAVLRKRGRLSKDELGALSREPLLKELGRENVMWPWLRGHLARFLKALHRNRLDTLNVASGYIEDRGRHLFVT